MAVTAFCFNTIRILADYQRPLNTPFSIGECITKGVVRSATSVFCSLKGRKGAFQ